MSKQYMPSGDFETRILLLTEQRPRTWIEAGRVSGYVWKIYMYPCKYPAFIRMRHSGPIRVVPPTGTGMDYRVYKGKYRYDEALNFLVELYIRVAAAELSDWCKEEI